MSGTVRASVTFSGPEMLPKPWEPAEFRTNHPLGSCRMAVSVRSSLLHGQAVPCGPAGVVGPLPWIGSAGRGRDGSDLIGT